jgi:S-adenosyl-L-methionine hydrolase (adenosine-forming)
VFLTDYGLVDEFVGVCHGVMSRIAPDARIVDLTHAIPRQDVLRGAIVLGRAIAYMPADAVYVAVVDPGVGSARRPVAVTAASGASLVGPDNGVLSIAWEALGGADSAVQISDERFLLHPVSRTFHGRDVFAPAGAHLAKGVSPAELGPSVDPGSLETLETPGATVLPGKIGARVARVDSFGNVQLNVRLDELEAAGLGGRLTVAGRRVTVVGVFSDVAEGTLAAIVDSQGQLALVVNRGSAARVLGLAEGASVVLE